MNEETEILNYLFSLDWSGTLNEGKIPNFTSELLKVNISNDCITKLEIYWNTYLYLDIYNVATDSLINSSKLNIDDIDVLLKKKLLNYFNGESEKDITDYIKILKRNYKISKL